MDYMEGGDLETWNKQKGRLMEDNAKFLFLQMCNALSYLHSLKITHRDLKPSHILLKYAKDNTLIKIADFQISKLMPKYSNFHTFCGTPRVSTTNTHYTVQCTH